MVRLTISVCAVALAAATAARAQDTLTTARAGCVPTAYLHVDELFSDRMDLARVLELAGATPVRPMMVRRASSEAETPVCAERARPLAWALSPAEGGGAGLEARFVPIALELAYNSAYPRDRNNGALWAGVGPTVAASGGVRIHWKWLSAAAAPRVIRETNGAFEFPTDNIPGRSPFGDVSQPSIDWPRRFGASSYTTVEPGQSYLRADVGFAAAGVSTENVWIGPSRIHPIMMSSTAPGFPHVFLGTSGSVHTPLGPVEGQALLGKLRESAYFDAKPNDNRLISGFVLDWMPRWVPGLALGGAFLNMELLPPGGYSFGHYIRGIIPSSFFGNAGNAGGADRLGALYARWALPESGFEVYGEWTREDTPGNWQDLMAEPDWTQAYSLGVEQVVRGRSRWARLYGELTHLGESAPVRAGRGFFSYYTHGTVIQGLTNRGQLLGAALGPGSDGETVGLDVYYGRGSTGAFVERSRYDDDTYYEAWARRWGETRHDWEITGGVRQSLALGPVDLQGSAGYSRRYNRYFLRLDDPTATPLVEGNWGLSLRASWAPRFPLARRAAAPSRVTEPQPGR